MLTFLFYYILSTTLRFYYDETTLRMFLAFSKFVVDTNDHEDLVRFYNDLTTTPNMFHNFWGRNVLVILVGGSINAPVKYC